MSDKKTISKEVENLASVRKRAAATRRQLEKKPSPSELLTPQELSDAAPFYFELRSFLHQLKETRERTGVTLAELADRTGLAVETLSRLETGALTNPTWKTLGLYTASLGLRLRLVLEAPIAGNESKNGSKR
jgi:DNA-binding XRE family transcriptional regulator